MPPIETPRASQRLPSKPSAQDVADAEEILRRSGRSVPVRGAPERRGPLQRFKLVVGTHRHAGVTYKAGEVIECDVDLVALFGRNKFSPLTRRKRLENRTQGGGPLPTRQMEGVAPTQSELERDTAQDTTQGGGDLLEEEVEDESDVEADDEEMEGEGDTLDSMTVDELKKHAEAEEIDLGGATRKADILRAIRKAGG